MAKVTLPTRHVFSDPLQDLPWQAQDAVAVIRRFHNGVVRPASTIGPQSLVSVGRTMGHNSAKDLTDGIRQLQVDGYVELNGDETNISVTQKGYEALFR